MGAQPRDACTLLPALQSPRDVWLSGVTQKAKLWRKGNSRELLYWGIPALSFLGCSLCQGPVWPVLLSNSSSFRTQTQCHLLGLFPDIRHVSVRDLSYALHPHLHVTTHCTCSWQDCDPNA